MIESDACYGKLDKVLSNKMQTNANSEIRVLESQETYLSARTTELAT